MDKLRIFWPHPKVAFNGRGISEAWAEEIAALGFEPVQEPAGADMAFFASDSQLREDVIGTMPTVAMHWGWPPGRLLDPGNRDFYLYKAALMATCTRVLTPTPATYEQLCAFGVPSMDCIPGVDAKTLDYGRTLPATERTFSVAFLSRLMPYKGLDTLITAVSLLQPQPKLIVMGPGDITPYEALAAKLGVEAIFIEPDDKEKVWWILQAGILVHPSIYEGWGLSSLEALYLGTPVIASDIPVHRWVLQEDAYYASSVDNLAGMLTHVFNNMPEALERAAHASKRISDSLTLTEAAARLWAHLHQAHKDHWGRLIQQDPHDKDLMRRAYEAEHRRNWAYGMGPEGWGAPLRFDPHWSRHWRASLFLEELKKVNAKRVLELGPGPVYPTIEAMQGYHVHAVDISQECLDQVMAIAQKWGVARNIRTTQAMAQEVDAFIPEGSMDAAVLGEILEHLPDPDVVLAQAYRAIRPGGAIILSTPLGGHHGDPHHIGPVKGGWDEASMDALLAPYRAEVTRKEMVAEGGPDDEPSCYLAVIHKKAT